jgi:hypothetical protein
MYAIYNSALMGIPNANLSNYIMEGNKPTYSPVYEKPGFLDLPTNLEP